MPYIEKMKQNVRKMEAEQDWMAVCEYLRTEWERHPESPERCTLLMQQAMDYFLAADEGSSPYLSLHKNSGPGSCEYYRECFVNALKDGLCRHTHDKYFVWQCCFYLAHSATYYPVFEALDDASGVEKEMERLLQLAKTNFEGSLIFSPFIEGANFYDWVRSLNEKEKAALQTEIAQFHLCENSADENVKDLFDYTSAGLCYKFEE